MLYASMDTASGEVKVWRSLFQDDATGGIECKHGDGKAEWDLPTSHISMLAFGELAIPADSGSSKTDVP